MLSGQLLGLIIPTVAKWSKACPVSKDCCDFETSVSLWLFLPCSSTQRRLLSTSKAIIGLHQYYHNSTNVFKKYCINAFQITGRKTILCYDCRFGLRKNCSTNHAITYFYETILQERDGNRSVCGSFFDFANRERERILYLPSDA